VIQVHQRPSNREFAMTRESGIQVWSGIAGHFVSLSYVHKWLDRPD
jgi:hypothetical protein